MSKLSAVKLHKRQKRRLDVMSAEINKLREEKNPKKREQIINRLHHLKLEIVMNEGKQ